MNDFNRERERKKERERERERERGHVLHGAGFSNSRDLKDTN